MRNWLTFTLLWSSIGLSLAGSAAAQEPPAPEPKPLVNSPLTPEESQKHFQIDPDCRIELVAAEPDVSAPVSIAFDEKGQLWVVEMHDYPNGPAPGEPGKSRIRVLTDEDGDGKYSHPRVFVDQLLFANSLMHWDGGVLVTTDGKLIYFKDTDGDGKSDLREVWFEGFATENPQLRCNHPTFGPDNWIYVANGLRNGKVRAVRPKWPNPAPEGAKLGEPVDISGRDFRFHPFTGECEAVSGYGQFGLTFDDEGNRYVCSNRNPCMKVIIEERHLKLNPNLAVPRVVEDVSPAGEQSKLYPISRAWTTSNLHAGQFSAACGLIFYRGTALPERFYNQSFTCDPTGNLVHFNSATHRNPLKLAPEREFLASEETWFRPVNTAMGPDGALYIVDMYRAVIEHPEYMPTELKNRPDLSLGAERGRIWRITAKPGEPGGVSPRSAPLPIEPIEIAKLVSHPNGWHRDTAHRLLVSRQAILAEPELLRILFEGNPSNWGACLALRVLDGIGLLEPKDITGALLAGDPEPPVQDNPLYRVPLTKVQFGERRLTLEAIRLADQFIATDASLADRLLNLRKQYPDESQLDRIHLVFGFLASGDTERRIQLALARLECSEKDENPKLPLPLPAGYPPFHIEPVTAAYIAIGAGPSLPEILIKQLDARPNRLCGQLPPQLIETALRSSSADQMKSIFFHLVRHKNAEGVLAAVNVLQSRGTSIDSLLTSQELAGSWSHFERWNAQSCFDISVAEVRLNTSISLLRFANAELAQSTLKQLIKDSSSSTIGAAIQSTASLKDPFGMELMLSKLEQRTPAVRSLVIDGLLTSELRITKLLDLIESSQVSFLEIGQTRLASLQQVKNPEIQTRLQTLIAANAPADRSKVLEEYQAALAHEHDPLRGRELFAKNCAQCHKIGDLGVEVAPNISDSRVKTQAQLLTDILDPNRAIDNNYFSYTLVDKAGTVATGIISAETSSSVTLKQPEGKTLTVLRSDIEQLKPNGVSLMPVGFEKQLTVAQMADVISFVKNWRYLDGSVPKEVIK
jgi:putative membrane-bound dehydrogenase-like protein